MYPRSPDYRLLAMTNYIIMTEEKKPTKKKLEPTTTPVVSDKVDAPAGQSLMTEKLPENEIDLVVKSDLNQPEALPEEVLKKLEKNKADKKVIKRKGKKKKVAKKIVVGVAHVKATYNNTIVTLTDLAGNVIAWASAGLAGFKGPKKSTPYAAQIITRIAVEKAKEAGLQEVSVFVKGVGTGRESAIRALNANGLIISSIKDVTPIPHNGCRAKKPRRV
jgi:small subunit ribosomal protein S11